MQRRKDGICSVKGAKRRPVLRHTAGDKSVAAPLEQFNSIQYISVMTLIMQKGAVTYKAQLFRRVFQNIIMIKKSA